MKILCLHGDNQSGHILQKQLDAVVSLVENSETGASFDFADAPIHCAEGALPKGQATEYKFFDSSATTEIYKAHEWLSEKLDANGPYDGVIGFSQGASLVSSYLLYHQWYNHEGPPPFRFATFISGSISLAVLRDLGVPVTRIADQVVEEAESRRSKQMGPLPLHVSLARQALFNSDDCFGLNLNHVPPELKIRIPTVHIWGVKDPNFPASIHLTGLCDPYIRKIYTHDNGHEVPQGTKDTEQIGQLVLWCMRRAIWPGDLRA